MERLVIAGKVENGRLTAKTVDDTIAALLRGNARELTMADIIALEISCEKAAKREGGAL